MKRQLLTYLTALLFSLNIAVPAFASHGSALCISFWENNSMERAVFASFAWLTCTHYAEHLVITNKPRTDTYNTSPSRVEKIREFLNLSKQVDIFVFGHTNRSAEWFKENFSSEMAGKIRLVYNSGCTDGNVEEAETWLSFAKTYVGHKGDNYGGKYTPIFVRHWLRGRSIDDVVRLTNSRLDKSHYFEGDNDPYGYVYGDEQLHR